MSKELEFILQLIKVSPNFSDDYIAALVGTTTKRVADLRKEFINLESNLQKVTFLIQLFPDWGMGKIAEFGNIPIEEVGRILEK